jgi:hypothetical protein
MDSKLAKTTLLVIGICLLLSLVCNVPRCSAQNSWSDDFSDGNYIGWTIEEGTFDASNYILETTGDAGGLSEWHSIHHSSQVAYGNWSLDMYINGTERIGYFISFIADSLFEYGPGFLMPSNGYAIWFYSTGPAEVGLERWTNDDYTALGSTWNPSSLHGWQNITITRDNTGVFTFSVNGTSRITATDNTHTTSQVFGWTCDPWSAIDNVIVNEPDGNKNHRIPLELLLLIGGVVVIIVIVIIAVIYLRRRS